ncbi:11923_t:CDS:10 [Ambispora leptoticha]|uniref:11923_t:CDS:1 n=1 Tax=Ambispora leptoticha TaxID=144679 RepID=A0A9N8YQ86_9GLOM|nr:11923_t:CDS:10 [Ambispora leptoticha]
MKRITYRTCHRKYFNLLFLLITILSPLLPTHGGNSNFVYSLQWYNPISSYFMKEQQQQKSPYVEYDDHDYDNGGHPSSEPELVEEGWTENLLKLSEEERIVIEHGYGSLAQYEKSKEDCFKSAARELKNGCKDIDLNEENKIKYAVRLTQCEIATANLAAPMECQINNINSYNYKNDKDNNYNNDIGKCVESLSRIPQLWTSYSGYFREVFNMCFAVRYSIEREQLEQLHNNLTRSQLVNFDILRLQQREMIQWRKEEMQKLVNLEKAQHRIVAAVREIESGTGFVTNIMSKVKENLTEVHLIAEHIHTKQQETIDKLSDVANITAEIYDNARNQILGVSESLDTFQESFQGIESNAKNLKEFQEATQQMLSHLKEITKESANKTTENLKMFSMELEKFQETAKKVYEKIVNTGVQYSGILQRESTENNLQQSLGKLQESLRGLELLHIGINKIAAVQQELYNDLLEQKKERQTLEKEWHDSFNEVKENFYALLQISQSEIRLLTETTADARESHKDIINLVRPLSRFMDLLGFLSAEISSHGVIHGTMIALLSTIMLRRIASWVNFDYFWMPFFVNFSNFGCLFIFGKILGWEHSLQICMMTTIIIMSLLLVSALIKMITRLRRRQQHDLVLVGDGGGVLKTIIIMILKSRSHYRQIEQVPTSTGTVTITRRRSRRRLGDAYFANSLVVRKVNGQ